MRLNKFIQQKTRVVKARVFCFNTTIVRCKPVDTSMKDTDTSFNTTIVRCKYYSSHLKGEIVMTVSILQ